MVRCHDLAMLPPSASSEPPAGQMSWCFNIQRLCEDCYIVDDGREVSLMTECVLRQQLQQLGVRHEL